MKIKISELNANPFKKNINGGKLNEQTIEKITSNLDELGLMGALPVFKKDDKYFLIAGHHRIEAVKRKFGKDFEIEVTLHDYSEDNVIRGMVIENLTQRTNELMEVTENLAMIREYLKKKTTCSAAEQVVKRPQGGGSQHINGSIRQIYDWLNKQGEIMSIGKISTFLKVNDNLDKTLIKDTNIEDAKNLSRIKNQKDQVIIRDILDKTGLDYKEKSKLISQYNEADEDIKEKVKSKEIDITNIREAVLDQELKKGQEGKIYEFIPNFKHRMQDFSFNVTKLEQQVMMFRKVFRSEQFSTRYKLLPKEKREVVNSSIEQIKDRIQKCSEEVNFFMNKLSEGQKLIEVQK